MQNPNDPPPNGVNGYCSLCHPWASGATRWLTDNVLGLRSTSPGFSTYEFAPYLDMQSLSFVSGSVLTPHGNLSASLDLTAGSMYVLAPQSTLGSLHIPKLQGSISALYERSLGLVYTSADGVRKLFRSVTEDSSHVRLHGLPAGEYHFEIKFAALPVPTPQAEQSNSSYYAALTLGSDLITQGAWKERYGSLGYVMFNCHSPGQHISSLPSFVTSVSSQVPAEDTCCYVARNITWTANTTDFRALQDPTSGSGSSCIGAVATWLDSTSYPLVETFHVDVNVAPSNGAWYRVSLYFVDFDLQDRQTMIQIYDGGGKQTIAPWQQITSFGGGQYISFAYNSSIRFRINFVRGNDDSVLSAIFFDPYTSQM
jgi:alpha-L-rhamnosidase